MCARRLLSLISILLISFSIYSQDWKSWTSELDNLEEQYIKSVTVDADLFNDTRNLLDSGITKHQNIPWQGPCEDNPFRLQRFQSHFEVLGHRFITADRFLVFTISMVGGDPCHCDLKLLWDGVIARGRAGRKAANLIISFKNIDSHRNIRIQKVAFDLSAFALKPKERILFHIHGIDEPVEFTMPEP